MKTFCGSGTCSCAKFHSDPNLCDRSVYLPRQRRSDNLRILVSRNKREGRYAGYRVLRIDDKHQRVGPDAEESGIWSLKYKPRKP